MFLCAECKKPANHDPRVCPERRRPSFVTRALVGTGVVGLVAGMMNLADGNGPTGILMKHAVPLFYGKH